MRYHTLVFALFTSFIISTSIVIAEGAGIAGDAEAAKHGFEASEVRIVDEITEPDFVFRQFDLATLSHYSYLIGSKGECIIVDPARDVSVYIQTAKNLGLKIAGVYLTHSHADFVAGHMELNKETGAPIYVNRKSGVSFDHRPVSDRFELKFGSLKAVIRETPGHTPDGTCMFVHHPADAAEPRLCLTGDTLFIGSVGRPDLMGGTWTAAELATMIYETWNNILAKVPDSTQIYPAHGAGSLCGANLSDANVSTFGEQKQTNPYTKHKDLSTFIMAVLDGLPQAPQYFAKNAAMNQNGPPLVAWNQTLPKILNPRDVQTQESNGAWILDVRDAAEFAAGHIPNSINIPIRGRFETWTGIMIPWKAPVILVGSDDQIKEAVFRLHRIGYDDFTGYLKGGTETWKSSNMPLRKVGLVQPEELFGQMKNGTAPILVDVRLPKEWMALRIAEQLLNMPIDRLFDEGKKLNPKMPVMTICNSAYRSSMGASVLLKSGFQDVRNLDGGSQAWIEAGYPTFSAKPDAGPGGQTPLVYVDLPEPIHPVTLAKQLMEIPGSLEIIDIRPDWQYQEFHIADSVNAAPANVMNSNHYLVGKIPLVLVCRDGSLAASVGGAISGKTDRPIRYLTGGVQAYYETVMNPGGIVTEKMIPRSAASSSESKPQGSAPNPAPKKKKVSAGC